MSRPEGGSRAKSWRREVRPSIRDRGHAGCCFHRPSGIWIDKANDLLYVAAAGQDAGIRIASAKDGTLTTIIRDTSPEVVIADSEGKVYSGLVGGKQLQQYVKK